MDTREAITALAAALEELAADLEALEAELQDALARPDDIPEGVVAHQPACADGIREQAIVIDRPSTTVERNQEQATASLEARAKLVHHPASADGVETRLHDTQDVRYVRGAGGPLRGNTT